MTVKAPGNTPEAPAAPREVTARVVSEVFDEEWLRGWAEALKDLSKGYPVEHNCPECGFRKKIIVQIPDFRGITDSVLELWNQAFGRPGTADAEPGGVTIIVNRVWPGDDADSRDREHVHAAAPASGSAPLEG